jgi:predicted small lipoprotein YifL
MTKNILIALASFMLLSACGVSGPLEKGPPLFGADRVAYEAEQAKKEEERKAQEAARAARAAAREAARNPAPTPAPKN